jgi:hypothetical protein
MEVKVSGSKEFLNKRNITGASSGIGKTCFLYFLNAGQCSSIRERYGDDEKTMLIVFRYYQPLKLNLPELLSLNHQ